MGEAGLTPLRRLLAEGGLRIDRLGEGGQVALRTVVALDGDVTQFVSPRWIASTPRDLVAQQLQEHGAAVARQVQAALDPVSRWVTRGTAGLAAVAGAGAGSGLSLGGLDLQPVLATVVPAGYLAWPGAGAVLNIVLAWGIGAGAWPWLRGRAVTLGWALLRPLVLRRLTGGLRMATQGRLPGEDEVGRRGA